MLLLRDYWLLKSVFYEVGYLICETYIGMCVCMYVCMYVCV